jgi:hypothetical protein
MDELLQDWYGRHAPAAVTRDPYAILVSEGMTTPNAANQHWTSG